MYVPRRHINENYFISDLGRYTGLGKHLLTSPFRRSVDYRIDAYLEVFQIASMVVFSTPVFYGADTPIGHAKRNFHIPNNIMSEPISSENMELLEMSNQELDSWFHRHSTDVDPIYQSYSKPQDRNRMKIPYNLVRMYVLCNKIGSFVSVLAVEITNYPRYTNGYVLHGLKQGTSEIHPLRLHFIKLTVGAGVELLSCAIQSMNYQLTLKYSIVSFFFLRHATRYSHNWIDLGLFRLLTRSGNKVFASCMQGCLPSPGL